MIAFPIYPLRKYVKIYEEDGLKYILARKLWVLDMAESDEPSYAARRMQLKREGCPLYPLRNGCYTYSQLIENRKTHKKFIDATGKIIQFTPSTFYKVVPLEITEKWVSKEVPKLMFALEGSSEIYEIPAPNYVANYARVVIIGNRRILFDVTETRGEPTRVKL